MSTLRVNDVLGDKILISRESAHLLKDALSAVIAAPGTPGDPKGATVSVDFEGIEGIAPSFLDELLLVFESLIGFGPDVWKRSLIVVNPPTRLSLKFKAIARGHGMSVQADSDGSWHLTENGSDNT